MKVICDSFVEVFITRRSGWFLENMPMTSPHLIPLVSIRDSKTGKILRFYIRSFHVWGCWTDISINFFRHLRVGGEPWSHGQSMALHIRYRWQSQSWCRCGVEGNIAINGHWPGTVPPESCFFGQMLNIGSLLVVITFFIRLLLHHSRQTIIKGLFAFCTALSDH